MTDHGQCRGLMINTDEDSWITLALALLVLPLCAYFLVDTWRRWLATHRRSGPSASSHTHATGSSVQAAGRTASSSSPSQSKHAQSSTTDSATHGQSIHANRSAAGSKAAVQETWVDYAKYWAKKMFRPRGLNQLLGNLLLASWTILAFDQLFHVIFILCVTFVCPSYNCRNYQSFATPGCPAGLFEGLQLIIQPFGSCCFIVATVNRFVNVYSQLSRRRYIALRLATTIVCLVCTCMSIVTAFAFSIMSSTTSTQQQVKQARELLLFGDFVTYSSIGIISILALMMGLDYVIKTRKAASVLHHTTKKQPQASNPAKASAPAATSQSTSSSLDPSPAPSIISLQPSVRQSASTHPAASNTIWHRIWADERRKSVTTVLCIFINVSIIVMFLAEHPFMKDQTPVSGTAAAKPSALLDSAVMSLSHKLFCAMVTIAIHQMTNLVLSKN